MNNLIIKTSCSKYLPGSVYRLHFTAKNNRRDRVENIGQDDIEGDKPRRIDIRDMKNRILYAIGAHKHTGTLRELICKHLSGTRRSDLYIYTFDAVQIHAITSTHIDFTLIRCTSRAKRAQALINQKLSVYVCGGRIYDKFEFMMAHRGLYEYGFPIPKLQHKRAVDVTGLVKKYENVIRNINTYRLLDYWVL